MDFIEELKKNYEELEELEDSIHDIIVNLLYDTKADFKPHDIDAAVGCIMVLIDNG